MNPELHRQFISCRLSKRTLWAPGPHELTPAIIKVLENYRTTFTHRSKEYRIIYRKTVNLLREVFHIPDDYTPLIFGHTGSYNWEMIAVNTPSGINTIGLDFGAFSKKWIQVFQNRGRNIEVLQADWGDGIQPELWKETISKGHDLALLTHNETSTGVMLPIEKMCTIARQVSPKTLIAIDGVSIAGAIEIQIDTLQPDYYLWSLQKDFTIPAIGSVMVVSNRAIKTARDVPHRGYVMDLIEWIHRAKTDQTPMTVADLTLHCLIARLEEIRDEGAAGFSRHRNLSKIQREWAEKQGLRLLARPGFESPTVTTIFLPESISGPDFVIAARDLLNVQLAPGYGPTANRAFRVAAMGHTSEKCMAQILEGLTLILDNWPEIHSC